MKLIYQTGLLALVLTLISLQTFSQKPGLINRQATSAAGRLVLDPNGDGYTSATTAGFGNDDVANSELQYKSIRAYSIEPFGDLRRGPNHNFSDFVPDAQGNGVYHRFSAAGNVMFRMRLGSIMPGSKGYSILMDTDGKFGATGPNADPNFQATTTGTNGNPGFEIEIVLETNFRIAIYNVDGTSSPILIKQYTNWQEMSQISIASTNDDGDPDFLIDFYIPFADLQAAPFNLTAASSIRLCATTVMAPKAATGGPRSDIYGTSGDTYEDFMDGQPTCAIFNIGANCVTAMCTAAPSVNSPISAGTVNISGTWSKSALPGAASTASITVYKNNVEIGTITNVSSGTTWTLNNITLINGDTIRAKAMASGETMCLNSNAVLASTCSQANRPATPTLTCVSGSKGIEGTNLSTGWTVYVENMTRSVPDNNVANSTGLFGAATGTSPNLVWQYSGGCSTGAPLTSGSYKVYYVNNASGCASLPAYFCAAGNGGNALAGSLAVPTINSPAGAVFTTATKSISGVSEVGATLRLYINSTVVQTVVATAGGAFSFPNLNLLNGQQLYISAELNTGTVGTSKCASQTPMYTVSCFTQTPLINADNNNQLTAGAPITGTSGSVAGTTIRVYTAAVSLVATTTVQPNGTWSTGNAGTLPAVFNAVAGTSYYANAQNGSCGVSGNSATYAATAPTSASRCGSIDGPIMAGTSSISGTLTGSFSTTTVNLYLDGELIGAATTNGTGWGPITVNTTPGNTLYSNGVLTIGVQEAGKQEVDCITAKTAIQCSPSPTAPVYTLSSNNVNQDQSVTCTITNAVAGAFYALSDSSTGQSFGQGAWATSNGNLVLTTSAFSEPGTYKIKVNSTSLTGITVCKAVSASSTIIVNPVVLPLNLMQFSGKKQAETVVLNWSTSSEINTSNFEIERSNNGSDFQKIGNVAAARNYTGARSYSFIDVNPLNGYSYYRLKMLDVDGRFSHSKQVAIFANKHELTINSLQPNPFTTYVSVAFEVAQTQVATIQLTDLSGRIVASRQFKITAGANQVMFDGLTGLNKGMYLVKVITNEATAVQKIMKVN